MRTKRWWLREIKSGLKLRRNKNPEIAKRNRARVRHAIQQIREGNYLPEITGE